MTCEAEEQALADIRKHKRDAELHLQQERAKAESALIRLTASVYDWSAVRRAEAFLRCWEERSTYAEDALARCKERRGRLKHD